MLSQCGGEVNEIPLAVLESDGKLLSSQKNGEFEKARALGPEDLIAFLNR